MSIITSQQLTRYIEQYGNTEVTFTKQVISATGLVARGVYLKVLDRQLPCVVFSSSLKAAKVIVAATSSFQSAVREAGNKIALRWCFKVPQEAEPITFHVSCRGAGFTPYNPENPEVQLVTLEYTQRPPDDLILILGGLLEATANSQRRRDERVIISPENMKKLGIESRDAVLSINGKPHKGFLRDLSFSGANILLPPIPQNAQGSTVTVKIAKGDQGGELLLLGTIKRIEKVGGRSDITVAAVEYVKDPPLAYKLLINTYLSSQSSQRVGGGSAPAGTAGPAAPAGGAAPASALRPDEAEFPDEEGSGDPGNG